MATYTPERGELSQAEGRLAPIFLSAEITGKETDLFDWSRQFHEKHRIFLQEDFGIISGLWQLDSEGERTAPPRETIVFDARAASEGTYAWELGYAFEPGVIQVARLQVRADGSEGMFAKTSNQGRFLPRASFDLTPDEACRVETRLIERLESAEVNEYIEEVYRRRLAVGRTIVRLQNQQAAEERKLALLMKVNRPLPYYVDRIKQQKELRDLTGFTPMLLFRPEWQKDQNT